MPAATDKFMKVGMSTATTLSAPGYTAGNTSITVGSTTNWPTDTGVVFAIDTVTIVNGEEVQDAGSYNEFVGTVATGTTITNVDWVDGDGDQDYAAGSTTRVYIPVSKTRENRLAEGMLVEHDQDGTHGDVTATSVTASGTITAANFVQSGGAGASGWTVGLATPNTVTTNGNRSYDMVFNGTDLTSTLSPGMRLRTTRTAPAPTQCTSLNGTTQYWVKTSPSAMTFTDDYTLSAWVKLSSYPSSDGQIVSRLNGTQGWDLSVTSTGQLQILGRNASLGSFRGAKSYQSLPLNKWVHVAAQNDMSTYTATPTTTYMMIDGVDVPIQLIQGGTNPTALVQAGNLEIGAYNSGVAPFPGKIAQVAIYNAKVTQANIRATISQGLTGSETSLISAYSFNNSTNDLSANANNLSAGAGSPTATNADSPFGGQADGTISSTLDYAIVQKASFSTNTTLTVQVPEGCTIPTSGGVSAVSYSNQKAPYGMPISREKWTIKTIAVTAQTVAFGGTGQWTATSLTISVPVGEYRIGHRAAVQLTSTVGGSRDGNFTLENSPTNGNYTNELVHKQYTNVSATGAATMTNRESWVNLVAQTTYTFYGSIVSATGSESFSINAGAPSILFAENSYL